MQFDSNCKYMGAEKQVAHMGCGAVGAKCLPRTCSFTVISACRIPAACREERGGGANAGRPASWLPLPAGRQEALFFLPAGAVSPEGAYGSCCPFRSFPGALPISRTVFFFMRPASWTLSEPLSYLWHGVLLKRVMPAVFRRWGMMEHIY